MLSYSIEFLYVFVYLVELLGFFFIDVWDIRFCIYMMENKLISYGYGGFSRTPRISFLTPCPFVAGRHVGKIT